MPLERYRPWGRLARIIHDAGEESWNYLGCLSAEDRTLAVWSQFWEEGVLESYTFIRVVDPPSRFSEDVANDIGEIQSDLENRGGDSERVCQMDLFCRVSDIVEGIDEFLQAAGENIVLDISTFPKRFFFPIVRRCLDQATARNIVACYTPARTYTTDDLAEDPEPWKKLPLYPERFPREEPETLVVGLGFQPLGLPDLMEEAYAEKDIELLFPFPAPPPNVQRVWGVVRRLEEYVAAPGVEPTFVAGYDVPEIFAHLRETCRDGARYAVLAPYGPKPMSLAMALIGRLAELPCYYTQPRAYNPDYSKGVIRVDEGVKSYGYYLRLDGRDVYQVDGVAG